LFFSNTAAAQACNPVKMNSMGHMKDPAAGMPPQLVMFTH
jgi:hypothetical protein